MGSDVAWLGRSAEEPLLLVDGLLELGEPAAPAHTLGAAEDLLAPQQRSTWAG